MVLSILQRTDSRVRIQTETIRTLRAIRRVLRRSMRPQHSTHARRSRHHQLSPLPLRQLKLGSFPHQLQLEAPMQAKAGTTWRRLEMWTIKTLQMAVKAVRGE
jgi:hypothetical protein